MLVDALRAAAHMAGTRAEVEHGRTRLRALETELAHRERTMETQLYHEETMFELKAGLMRDLIKALVEKRVDAVCMGFKETLGMYAEQSRHYMAQQDRYADAEIKATDPGEFARLKTRLSDIDIHLTSIRSDALALYREMNKVILLIGGTMPGMSSDDKRALGL